MKKSTRRELQREDCLRDEVSGFDGLKAEEGKEERDRGEGGE